MGGLLGIVSNWGGWVGCQVLCLKSVWVWHQKLVFKSVKFRWLHSLFIIPLHFISSSIALAVLYAVSLSTYHEFFICCCVINHTNFQKLLFSPHHYSSNFTCQFSWGQFNEWSTDRWGFEPWTLHFVVWCLTHWVTMPAFKFNPPKKVKFKLSKVFHFDSTYHTFLFRLIKTHLIKQHTKTTVR